MNRSQLVKAVAAHTGHEIKTADAVLKGFTDVVTAVAAKGEAVAISGFAKFARVESKARIGRNPATGAPVKIPARKRVRVTALKAFKDAVLNPTSAPKLAKGVWPPEAAPAAKKAAPGEKAAPAAKKAAPAARRPRPPPRRPHPRRGRLPPSRRLRSRRRRRRPRGHPPRRHPPGRHPQPRSADIVVGARASARVLTGRSAPRG